MTGHRSSVVPRAFALRAIMVLSIISIWFSAGSPRTLARSRDELSANRLKARLLNVPLSFEPNRGQAGSAVQFLSRGPGYGLFLNPGEVVLILERQQSAAAGTLRMSLAGANTKGNAVGSAPQRGVVSYFIGNDPKKWRSGIPTYGKVEYPEIYPGVDLVFYGNQRQLEYDFVVAPGADPGRIAWQIDGARASVDGQGNLALQANGGTASFEKPVVYQMNGERKTSVDASFAVTGDQVHFRLGNYDRTKALVIDPVLSYATYLGGTSTDTIGRSTGPGILQVSVSQAMAVDSSGSVYVTGTTYSVDFPAKNPYQGAPPAKLPGVSPGQWPSAFVTKFSPDGSSLIYSTYLGGNGYDYGNAIAVDSSGSAYVAGSTTSPNFPATGGAYQTVCAPFPNNTGIAISTSNCNSADYNVFVTKLNPAGNGLVYSTFLGGYGNWSYATAIALDSAGRAYVAGNEDTICQTSYTFQACFPTTSGAVIPGNKIKGGGPQYAFVAVFDPTGAHLLYSTLFGGTNFTCSNGCGGDAYATGITVDANLEFYLIGETRDASLPTTTGVVQPAALPPSTTGVLQSWRGFIAKFNPVTANAGSTLAYATYLGGATANTSDFLSGLAVDSAGNTYVAGYTNSRDFPVTPGTFGTVCGIGGTCAAAHVTKLNATATAIVWSTYVGDSKQDGSDAIFYSGPIQLDKNGNIYIIGQSGGSGFPMVNPVEPTPTGGSQEVMVIELDPAGANVLFSTRIGSNGLNTTSPAGLVVDPAGNIYVAGNTNGPSLITTPGAFQTTSRDGLCCQYGNGFVAKIAPGEPGPQLSASGVFNAATSQAGGIAPNEFISIFGTGLGPAIGAIASTPATLLGGTRVYIGGTAAYLTYAQDGQLNALVPFGISGAPSTTIQAEFNGVKGGSATVPVVNASPGIFTQAFGPGQAWVVNQDNTYNSSSNPAARSSYVAFWATGQGLVNTSLQDGAQPTAPWPTPILPVSVTVGGVPVSADNIIFDGLIFTGEIQVNIQIPANAPTGSAVPLVVTIGGTSSRSDATIAIR